MKRVALVCALSLVALVACSSDEGSSDGDAPFELDAAAVQTTDVGAVKSYRFDPTVVEIEVGDEVTWTNDDDFPHNVHFLTGRDDTHDLAIDESVTVAFDESGDFYYECSLHPQQMRGKVIVT